MSKTTKIMQVYRLYEPRGSPEKNSPCFIYISPSQQELPPAPIEKLDGKKYKCYYLYYGTVEVNPAKDGKLLLTYHELVRGRYSHIPDRIREGIEFVIKPKVLSVEGSFYKVNTIFPEYYINDWHRKNEWNPDVYVHEDLLTIVNPLAV